MQNGLNIIQRVAAYLSERHFELYHSCSNLDQLYSGDFTPAWYCVRRQVEEMPPSELGLVVAEEAKATSYMLSEPTHLYMFECLWDDRNLRFRTGLDLLRDLATAKIVAYIHNNYPGRHACEFQAKEHTL